MMTRRHSRGFTLVEVMVGLVVFMVAVVGLVAMQRAALVGKTNGEFHTGATNIAQFFLSQIRSEVESWARDPHDDGEACADFFSDLGTNGQNELLFVKQGVCNDYTDKPWLIFDEENEAVTFLIDKYLGHSEVSTGDDIARYCLNYRIEPMGAPPSPSDAQLAATMVWKIRVRVSWTRDGHFPAEWNNCRYDKVDDRLDGATDGPGEVTDQVVELVTLATRELAWQ